ncbi:TetR/AcrR family transcriptional regulator [Microbacterium sp. JZ70]
MTAPDVTTVTGAKRRRARTRRHLLDAAKTAFAAHGVAGCSIQTICGHAGYSRGAFYSNFTSKEQLLIELAAEIAHNTIARVRAVALVEAHSAGDWRARVRHAVDESLAEDSAVLILTEVRLLSIRLPEARDIARGFFASLESQTAALVSEFTSQRGLSLRMPVPLAARVVIALWLDEASRRAMRRHIGSDSAESDGDALWQAVAALVVA